MSGTPIMLKPLSHAASEEAYEGVMKAFGLENASVEERIEHLQNMTPEELVRLTPMSIPLVPFMDGDIITAMTSFKGLAKSDEDLKAEVPGRKWCEGLMIGDCQHDVYFPGSWLHLHGSTDVYRALCTFTWVSRSAKME
jgi:hypothetical protein